MSSGRLIFGVIIIIVGVLFLLDNTIESDTFGAISQWWPTLLVLLGVWRLIANRFRSLFWPFLLIAIGALLQLRQLEVIPGIDFGTYWPLIPIAIGIAILAGGFRRRRRRRNNPRSGSSAVIDIDPTPATVREGDNLNATLSSDNRAVSGDFHNGNINVVMGSGSLDLRQARIVSKPATLDVSVVMGEVKVRVPSEWNVQIANSATMGETKDTRGSQNAHGDTPDLVIDGSVTMGSLQITD